MSRTAPASATFIDEKKYKKALRFIYKNGQETNKLTEEAIEACKRQSISPEDLRCKTVEDFAVHPNADQQKGSPKNRHQAELKESEANLAQVRFKHHENRRRSKSCALIDQSNFSTSMQLS